MEMQAHFNKLNVKINSLASVEKVEQYLIEKCKAIGIDLSHDTMAEEPLSFKSIGYGYCAGSIIAYPQSTQAYNAYLIDAVRVGGTSVDNTPLFSKPVDKYTPSKQFNKQHIEKLVVLPGTNILKSLVDKNILLTLAQEKAYVKIHPITTKEDINLLTSIFKDRVIGSDYGLYDVFKVADTIYTTSASESAIYATMLEKPLFSIEEEGHNFRGAYSPMINTLFWSKDMETRKQMFNAIYNSSISNIFHPNGDYKARIDSFLNSVGSKCQQ